MNERLADLMFYLEQTLNQGKRHQDSFLSDQPKEVQDMWEDSANSMERFWRIHNE